MPCPHDKPPKWKPNGCGPLEGVTRWAQLRNRLLNFLVPELWFKEACDCHDIAYEVGAVRYLMPDARKVADRMFLTEMLEIAENLPLPRRLVARKLAMVYYQTVCEMGEDAFNWFDDIQAWNEHQKELGL